MSMFEKVILRAKGFQKNEVEEIQKTEVKIKSLENEVKRLEEIVRMNAGHDKAPSSIEAQNQLNKANEQLRRTIELHEAYKRRG